MQKAFGAGGIVLAAAYAVPQATITTGVPQANTTPHKWVKHSLKGVLEIEQLPRTGHCLLLRC